jgi:two-component system, response regulator PdtaR
MTEQQPCCSLISKVCLAHQDVNRHYRLCSGSVYSDMIFLREVRDFGRNVMFAALLTLGTVYLSAAATAGSPPAPDATPKANVKLPKKLLIVEDDYLVALEVERIVRKAGYAVVGIVATADEALRQAELYLPDLVLMDIRLATARDGIEAAIELRQKLNIDSLIVSSHIDQETLQRAAAASPSGFVSKPFSEATLARAIAAALSRS